MKQLIKNKISILLIILCFGFIACNSFSKNENEKVKTAEAKIQDVQETISKPTKSVKKQEALPTNITSPEMFNEIWQSLTLKSTPLIDTTNFDNFKEVKTFNREEIALFQLSKIYTDIDKEGHSYKIMPAYKLDLSDDFRTIVLNVFKGEHELETVLINYNLEEELIAHKIIAYDEIAEGWSRKYASIKDGMIAIMDLFYEDHTRIDTTHFHIKYFGEINPIKLKFSSNLRPDKIIALNQIYIDTIEFLSYNDDYDYWLIVGKKNGQEVGLIYNWDWMENEKYNFKIGELLKVKWKMSRVIHAGDEEILDFSEKVIDAERILSEDNIPLKAELINENKPQENELKKGINYLEFHPSKVQNLTLDSMVVQYAFQLENHKIVAGYDERVNQYAEQDWGDKLLLLNNENEILFKSLGVGDVYLFEPHFYKNKLTDKTIIICQLGFEYLFGGEAFVYENGVMTSIGFLDIESVDSEKGLTDIVEIHEEDNQIVFTFKSESLIYGPGTENIILKNDGIKYIYKNKELTLVK